MALDLDEQEQIDELKTWWTKNGKMVMTALTVGIAAYAAFVAWNSYQHSNAVGGSTRYQELLVTDTNDLNAIKAKAAVVMDEYASTPYAGRAALYAAKINYEAKDTKSAKAQLEWAIGNAKETSISALASLQLANVLVEENKPEEAMKLLEANHDAGFDGLFWDLKGDILAGMGKTSDAKSAYERALTKLEPMGKYRIVTQQKLDSLG
jgi:predicted negative regulator of RcsB-dependent stress response